MVIGFFGREINSNDEIGPIIHRRLNVIRSKTGLLAYHEVGIFIGEVNAFFTGFNKTVVG